MQTNCEMCGIKFEAKRTTRKYCSQRCNDAAQKQKQELNRQPITAKYCDHCGKLFTPKNNNKRFRFCSWQCKNKWINKHPKYAKICANCGKQFKTNEISHKYCSNLCAGKSGIPTRILKCVDCGKEFTFKGRTRKHRCKLCRPSWLKNYQKRKANEYIYKAGGKPNVGSGGNQWGTTNHQWRPANEHAGSYAANYRKRCYSLWPKRCIACDSTKGIQVHHIDGNPSNYEETNLIPLCWLHHIKQIHYKKWNTKEEYVEAFYSMLEKVCRTKIAEKIWNPDIQEGIRGEVQQQNVVQPQSIEGETEKNIILPRGSESSPYDKRYAEHTG